MTQQAAAAAAAAVAAAADTQACGRRLSSTIARGFVGQANPLAAEYHSTDYDWQQHAQETAPLVEAQWAGAPAAVREAAVVDAATGKPLSAVAQYLQQLQGHGGAAANGRSNGHVSSSTFKVTLEAVPPPAAAAAASPSPDNPESSSTSSNTDNEWEVFYQAHPAAKFFQERRYLLLEFPCLAPPCQLQHVVEIGAGCGSSILPVLRVQPHARATLSDISSTCLQQLLQACSHLGLDSTRVDAFVADGTSPELGQRLAGCAADAVLIMFTLSAVVPEGMLGMMRNAAAALRLGGVLCIRDHALYDMVQLRIPAEQCIGRHLYRRGDGTLAYFYTTEELAGLAAAAGLEVVECDYVCVVNRNRKTGQALRRAFVHGVFRKLQACSM